MAMGNRSGKEPLYRKVNTRARGVHHNFGGEYRHVRNGKVLTREQLTGTMHQNEKRGLDYTPLFRFLLSKVGSKWDDVYCEAKSRLDKTDPIFWMVSLNDLDRKEIMSVGESTYYSALYVDSDGILQIVAPHLKAEDLKHYCSCCTHTFNGKVY